jgi:hypothetical protein
MCHSCLVDEFGQPMAEGCTRCKGGFFLLDGVCVESCPAGYREQGSGSFDNVCVALAGGSTPSETTCTGVTTTEGGSCWCGTIGQCRICGWSSSLGALPGTCTQCKGGYFLLDGECVASCPAGYTEQGTGSFGNTCVQTSGSSGPDITSCVGVSTTEGGSCWCGDLGQCRSCGWSTSLGAPIADTCTQCKGGYFLLNGVCLESCPAGYTEQGEGSFSNTCVENTRRRRQAASATAAAGSQSSAGSSGLSSSLVSLIVATALVVGSVATIALVRRQRVVASRSNVDSHDVEHAMASAETATETTATLSLSDANLPPAPEMVNDLV